MKLQTIYTTYRAQFSNDFIMIVGTLQILTIAGVLIAGLIWLSQYTPIF